MIAPVVRVGQRDGDELALAPFRGADENAARVAGIAGLDADAAVVAPEQLIMVGQRPAGAGDRLRADHRAELLVLQCCLRERGKVARGRVILPAVESMGIGEMRLPQAERLRAQIHLPDEGLFAAGYADGERQRRVVAGMQHHAVEQIPPRQRLAPLQIHTGALQSHGKRRDRHAPVRLPCLTDKQTRHDLRGACDEGAAVRVLFIERLSRPPIDQSRARGADLRRRTDGRGPRGRDAAKQKGGGAECRRRFAQSVLIRIEHIHHPGISFCRVRGFYASSAAFSASFAAFFSAK